MRSTGGAAPQFVQNSSSPQASRQRSPCVSAPTQTPSTEHTASAGQVSLVSQASPKARRGRQLRVPLRSQKCPAGHSALWVQGEKRSESRQVPSWHRWPAAQGRPVQPWPSRPPSAQRPVSKSQTSGATQLIPCKQGWPRSGSIMQLPLPKVSQMAPATQPWSVNEVPGGSGTAISSRGASVSPPPRRSTQRPPSGIRGSHRRLSRLNSQPHPEPKSTRTRDKVRDTPGAYRRAGSPASAEV